MPLYLLEAPPISDAQRDEALRLIAWRYPEVALEGGYGHHDGDGQDVWLCRAPSPDCVSRWAAAAGLVVHDIRHVEPLELPPDARIEHQGANR
jgi:hypothetical protein